MERQIKLQRLLSLFIAVAMLVTTLPVAAFATGTQSDLVSVTATGQQSSFVPLVEEVTQITLDVSKPASDFEVGGEYGDYLGDFFDYSNGLITILKDGVTLTGTSAHDKNITVSNTFSGKISLNNVVVDHEGDMQKSAFLVPAGANVHFEMAGSSLNKFIGSKQCPGILVPEGATVTVSSKGLNNNKPGTLVVQSTHHAAMFGAEREKPVGTINIQSGKVDIYSYSDDNGNNSEGPGLGGKGNGGLINISGGVVRVEANGENANGVSAIAAKEINITGGAQVFAVGEDNGQQFDAARGNRGGIGSNDANCETTITVSGEDTVLTAFAAGKAYDLGGSKPGLTTIDMTGGTLRLLGTGVGPGVTTSFKNCTVEGAGAGSFEGDYDSEGNLIIPGASINIGNSDAELIAAAASSKGAFSFIDGIISILDNGVVLTGEINDTSGSRRIVVPASSQADTLVLNGLNLINRVSGLSPISIESGASITLELISGTNNRIVNDTTQRPAIHVPTGAELTIASSDGSNKGILYVGSDSLQSAVVGSAENENAGIVNIESGAIEVIAQNPSFAPGIGSAARYDDQPSVFEGINITGGLVSVKGGASKAPAIGSGVGTSGSVNGGPIVISGANTVVRIDTAATAHGAAIALGSGTGSGSSLTMTGGRLYFENPYSGPNLTNYEFKDCAVFGTAAGLLAGVYDSEGNKISGLEKPITTINLEGSRVDLENAAEASDGVFGLSGNEIQIFDDVTVMGSTSTLYLAVPQDVTGVSITLDGAIIEGTPIALKDGAEATIILKAGSENRLEAIRNIPAISAPFNTELTIKSSNPTGEEDEGKLIIGGQSGHSAAIGGDNRGRAGDSNDRRAGTINIESGYVEIETTTSDQSSAQGAGIGGGRGDGNGFVLNITGGILIARPGGPQGAGIGGTSSSQAAQINISGGAQVTSYGGVDGERVGVGINVLGGELSISGEGTQVRAHGSLTAEDITGGVGAVNISDNAVLFLNHNGMSPEAGPVATNATILGAGAGLHAGVYDADGIQDTFKVNITSAGKNLHEITTGVSEDIALYGEVDTLNILPDVSPLDKEFDVGGYAVFEYQKAGESDWTYIDGVKLANDSSVFSLTWENAGDLEPGDYLIRSIYSRFDANRDGHFAGTSASAGTLVVSAPVVPVTGITLSKSTSALIVGDTETLVATVAPADATNKDVAWTSSDEAVASVVDGVVSAVAPGTATITVTTAEGDFTATCAVTVTQPVTGITLNQTARTLAKGSTTTLKATVLPANANDKGVYWNSSNTKIAGINPYTGVVTAKAKGIATITARTRDGSHTATFKITVTQPVTSVRTAVSTLYLVRGTSVTIPAAVQPFNANETGLMWKSSNNKNVSVTSAGKVKGLKSGTSATITVTSKDGKKTATVRVYVVSKSLKTTRLNILSDRGLVVGKTTQIKPTWSSTKATGVIPTFFSSHHSVATIDKAGVITAKKAGTTKITVKANGRIRTFMLTVGTVAPTKVELNKKSAILRTNSKVSRTYLRVAKLVPANSNPKTVTWKSSKTSVATVNSKGVVIAKKKGTTTITVRTWNGKTATCKITVK